MATTSNFVLAFGGTGARCAEALAHLAAARVLAEPTYVLLVDPDENNGNTQRAVDQLARYHVLHAALERALAAFTGWPAALTFSTGYHANLSVVAALADRDTVVVSDAHNHASLIDACRLSRAEVVVTPLRPAGAAPTRPGG